MTGFEPPKPKFLPKTFFEDPKGPSQFSLGSNSLHTARPAQSSTSDLASEIVGAGRVRTATEQGLSRNALAYGAASKSLIPALLADPHLDHPKRLVRDYTDTATRFVISTPKSPDIQVQIAAWAEALYSNPEYQSFIRGIRAWAENILPFAERTRKLYLDANHRSFAELLLEAAHDGKLDSLFNGEIRDQWREAAAKFTNPAIEILQRAIGTEITSPQQSARAIIGAAFILTNFCNDKTAEILGIHLKKGEGQLSLPGFCLSTINLSMISRVVSPLLNAFPNQLDEISEILTRFIEIDPSIDRRREPDVILKGSLATLLSGTTKYLVRSANQETLTRIALSKQNSIPESTLEYLERIGAKLQEATGCRTGKYDGAFNLFYPGAASGADLVVKIDTIEGTATVVVADPSSSESFASQLVTGSLEDSFPIPGSCGMIFRSDGAINLNWAHLASGDASKILNPELVARAKRIVSTARSQLSLLASAHPDFFPAARWAGPVHLVLNQEKIILGADSDKVDLLPIRRKPPGQHDMALFETKLGRLISTDCTISDISPEPPARPTMDRLVDAGEIGTLPPEILHTLPITSVLGSEVKLALDFERASLKLLVLDRANTNHPEYRHFATIPIRSLQTPLPAETVEELLTRVSMKQDIFIGALDGRETSLKAPIHTTEFTEWVSTLHPDLQEVVNARVRRICRGLHGDFKQVGGHGMLEARIDHGGGLRIFYASDEQHILLLGGCDKSHKQNQSEAIHEAHERYSRIRQLKIEG